MPEMGVGGAPGRAFQKFSPETLQEVIYEVGGPTAPFMTDIRLGGIPGERATSGEATGAPPAPVPLAPLTIVANMDAGTYTGGGWPDDALNRRSYLVGSYGWSSRTFAPFTGDRAALLAALQELFRPFNTSVTDVRPASGQFIDCVITDSPSSVLGCGCGGLAPMSTDCSLIPTAIVFVFAPGFGSARRIAEVAAQEIGHAIGLDHEMECDDPMSYLNCEPKSFQDVYAACGEYQARACQCGGTQNSYQELLRKLGPAGPPPPPGNATIKFLKPQQEEVTLKGNGEIEISVEVDDPQGISKVELVWEFTHNSLDCARGGNGVDWSCAHEEGTKVYTWKLDVGTGDRYYRVRVTDNNQPTPGTTESPRRVIHLTPDQPPTCAPPAIQMHGVGSQAVPGGGGPAPGAPLGSMENPVPPDTVFTISADVLPDAGTDVREVQLIWLEADGFVQFPMARVNSTTWRASLRVPAAAAAGSRRFCVRATTYRGDMAATEHESVHIGAAP